MTQPATDGHPFWVTAGGGWVDAVDLEPGDHLLALLLGAGASGSESDGRFIGFSEPPR